MERGNTLAQLQQLRELSLQEYLRMNLQDIATREVIGDVVSIFLKDCDAEFLQSVGESMREVVSSNQALKRRVEEMTAEGERMKVEMRSRLQEEARKSIEDAVGVERKERERWMEQAKQEKQAIESRWKADLVRFDGEMNKIVLQKELLESKFNSSAASVERLTKEVQKWQKTYSQRQQQWNVQSEKQSHEISRLQTEIKSQNNELVNLREKTSRMLSMQAQIISKNQEIEQLHSDLREVNKIKGQLIEQVKEATVKIEQQEQIIAKIQLNNADLQQQITKTTNNLHQQQMEANTLRIYNEDLTSQRHIAQQSKKQMQKELQTIKTEAQNLKATLDEQEPLLLQSQQQVWSYNSQLQTLKEQNETLNQELQHLQTHIYQQQSICLTQQEQIKTLQTQLHRIAEQTKAEITTHRAAFDINTQALAQELAQLQLDNKELRENIEQLHEQLALNHEKDKYYEIYMQEIGSLKKELQKYKPSKNSTYYNMTSEGVEQITKRSRVYQIICKLSKEVSYLKLQKKQLIKKIQFESQEAIRFLHQAVDLIVSKVKEETLLCSLCQHQNFTKTTIKTVSPSKHPKMDKTIPILAFQADAYTKIRKNLKAVQQKYQLINQQNKQFTHHISSLINNQ